MANEGRVGACGETPAQRWLALLVAAVVVAGLVVLMRQDSGGRLASLEQRLTQVELQLEEGRHARRVVHEEADEREPLFVGRNEDEPRRGSAGFKPFGPEGKVLAEENAVGPAPPKAESVVKRVVVREIAAKEPAPKEKDSPLLDRIITQRHDGEKESLHGEEKSQPLEKESLHQSVAHKQQQPESEREARLSLVAKHRRKVAAAAAALDAAGEANEEAREAEAEHEGEVGKAKAQSRVAAVGAEAGDDAERAERRVREKKHVQRRKSKHRTSVGAAANVHLDPLAHSAARKSKESKR